MNSVIFLAVTPLPSLAAALILITPSVVQFIFPSLAGDPVSTVNVHAVPESIEKLTLGVFAFDGTIVTLKLIAVSITRSLTPISIALNGAKKINESFICEKLNALHASNPKREKRFFHSK